MYMSCMYACAGVHKKQILVKLGSQRSLDSGCFELVSSHQQGICITCLAYHPALYTHIVYNCTAHTCIYNVVNQPVHVMHIYIVHVHVHVKAVSSFTISLSFPNASVLCTYFPCTCTIPYRHHRRSGGWRRWKE